MSFNKILVSLASTALLASATTGFSAMLTSNNQAIDYGTLSVMDAGNAGDISITTGSGISVQAAAVSPGMVYENVEAVEGSSYSVVALEDLALGEYQLTLTDFEFFDPFERLGAALTTASQSVAELILTDMAQDSITFNIGNQDSYYLSIFAQGATQSALGLYGIELDYLDGTNVPLPGAAVLFLSALLGMAWIKRDALV